MCGRVQFVTPFIVQRHKAIRVALRKCVREANVVQDEIQHRSGQWKMLVAEVHVRSRRSKPTTIAVHNKDAALLVPRQTTTDPLEQKIGKLLRTDAGNARTAQSCRHQVEPATSNHLLRSPFFLSPAAFLTR